MQALPPSGRRRGTPDRPAPQRHLRPRGRLPRGFSLLPGDEVGRSGRPGLDRGDARCVAHRPARSRAALAHEFRRDGGGGGPGGCAGMAERLLRRPLRSSAGGADRHARGVRPRSEAPHHSGRPRVRRLSGGRMRDLPPLGRERSRHPFDNGMAARGLRDSLASLQARKEGASVMQLVAGRLSDEEIAALAAHFRIAKDDP